MYYLACFYVGKKRYRPIETMLFECKVTFLGRLSEQKLDFLLTTATKALREQPSQNLHSGCCIRIPFFSPSHAEESGNVPPEGFFGASREKKTSLFWQGWGAPSSEVFGLFRIYRAPCARELGDPLSRCMETSPSETVGS